MDKFPKHFQKKPQKPGLNEVIFEHGKISPQAIELEEGVLGALLISERDSSIMPIFEPKIFYKKAHQIIATGILELHLEDVPYDMLMVVERLRFKGELDMAGGPYFITTLVNKVSSDANIAFWYKIVQQKFISREIIRIGSEMIRLAYDDCTDIFEMLDDAREQLEALDLSKHEKISQNNMSITSMVLKSMTKVADRGKSLFYRTRWANFDSRVITGPNKIILLAGGAKMGKTKFVAMWISGLLEDYAEISVCWITLEDSASDCVTHYLSSKVFIKGKDLKKKNFNPNLMPILNEHLDRWSKFDVEFIDQSLKIRKIAGIFKTFCDKRPDRFNILVIDNILSLDDRSDYKHDLNSFYDDVMNEILRIRQSSKALILVVHHFNDAQQNKDNLKDGYRPRLTDIKGTESFRRVPNQVLMINTPAKQKDLLAEYKGERKENLKSLYIIDVGASREDNNLDADDGVIHMLASLDYNVFKEVDYYDPEKGVKKGAMETFEHYTSDSNEQPF